MSQIGLDHQRIAPYLMRRTLGNDAPFRQNEYACAQGHDEFHLMLDDDERRFALGWMGLTPSAKVSERVEFTPPRRLIEQNKAGPGHEGHGGIEQLLLPVAQRAGLFIREM